MRDQFVQTSFGRIHYLHAGSGSPILLLHSNGCSAHEYEYVIPALAEKHEVFAWDMPGHGDSDPITRHFTIEDYCDALIAFMDAIGVRKAHILGSSVGGSICVAMGREHSDRVESLLVVETPTRTAEEWAADWDTVGAIFGVPTQDEEQLSARIRKVTPELMRRWNVDRNKAGTWTMFDVMWAIREFPIVDMLPEVKARSLVVLGDKGPVIGGKHHFENGLPGADVRVMSDCGHFPMFDEPEEFASIIVGHTGR